MTPREIIAKHLCTMAAHDWDKITPFQRAAFRTTANGFLAALTAAGFRIVGPDEWRDIEFVIEIANRNEASPEGERLAVELRETKRGQP